MRALLALAALLLAGAWAPLAAADEPALPSVARTLEGRTRDAYGLLTPPSGADPRDVADAYLVANAATLGIPGVDTLSLASARHSLASTHFRYAQSLGGLPVVGGEVSVHVRTDGAVLAVHSRAVERALDAPARLDAADAASRARAHGAGDVVAVRDVLLAEGLVGVPAFEVRFHQPLPLSAPVVFVDKATGAILRVDDDVLAAEATGRAWINPIVASGNMDLRDNNYGVENDPTPTKSLTSQDYSPWIHDVTLVDLEEGPRGPILAGPYVRVVDALAVGDDMRYTRDDPRFEEVLVYYWMDYARKELAKLGFYDLMNYTIPVYTHDQNGVYNAFYRRVPGGGSGEIHFGWHAPTAQMTGLPILPPSIPPGLPLRPRGFADSAEDAEVIVHEYGHAILDNAAPNFNGGPIHEGFADWISATLLSRESNGTSDWCLSEWFYSYVGVNSGGRPPCIRTLENELTYDYDAAGHSMGQIWSGALWNIRKEIGREPAETLVLEAIHLLPVDGSFHEGAEALLVADAALNDAANARLIIGEFARRNVTGLIVTQELLEQIRASDARLRPAEETTPLATPAVGVALLAVPVALAALASRRRA